LPFYGRWYRYLFWPLRRRLVAARVDPEWTKRAASRGQRSHARIFTQWITSQGEGHPDRPRKVVPRYRPPASARSGQRLAQALTRDNVELVRSGVARIEEGRGDRQRRPATRWT
jgi:hypothetical protein